MKPDIGFSLEEILSLLAVAIRTREEEEIESHLFIRVPLKRTKQVVTSLVHIGSLSTSKTYFGLHIVNSNRIDLYDERKGRSYSPVCILDTP